jgi:hypothetical protein
MTMMWHLLTENNVDRADLMSEKCPSWMSPIEVLDDGPLETDDHDERLSTSFIFFIYLLVSLLRSCRLLSR